MGTDAADTDKVGDTVSDNAGLSAAGTGKDENGTFDSLDGFSLGGVKVGKDVHVIIIAFIGVERPKRLKTNMKDDIIYMRICAY